MDRDDQDVKEEILFENHLLRVCSALGQQQEADYELGDETLGCLRDIKRFLRQDEELKDKASHRLLGKWNILKNDLVPILLKACQNDDFKLALASCEVLVPITWPIKKNNENLQDLEILKLYKQCFVTKGVWAAILKLLVQIVAIPSNEKTENHHARFKLLLLLVRNVLAIDESVSTTKYLDSTIHEDLVSLMHKEELMEFLLVLAASSSEIETRAWNSIVLEIFYFVFVNRNCANLLAQTHTPANNSNLGTLLEKEKLNKGKSSRQWRFGGTWSISTGVININQGGKSINTRKLPTKQNINFDTVKKQRKRIVIQDTYVEKRFIKPHCRAVFKEIADSFTLNCINELFSSVKREFDMQSTAITLEHHHQFLFLISFYFDYFLLTKSNDNQFDQITGIMNPKIGFYIFAKLYQYKLDKKYDALYYSARALNSFLVVLKEMFKSSIEALNQLAMFIQSAVFYELEHITLISSLCKDSKPRSLIYMKLVMELTENVFDLLQTSNTSQIVTRKKKALADGDESDLDDSGEAERMRQREKLYTLSRLDSTFGQESVIEYYCYLLVDFENLSALDLTNIVKMFNRITNTESLDREALFYKASYLYCFEKVLKSPLMAMENYRELKAILKLICAGAIKRFNEHPELVLELFFSKSRSDCVRIQDGLFQPDSDEIADERIPTLDEMLIEYKDVDCEDPMTGEYIRKLSSALSKEPNGSEFTRWLSKSMRQVLYDDMDDVVTGQQKQSGIILAYFVGAIDAPSSVADFITRDDAQLLLKLLGFKPILGELKFPDHITIESIEHLEQAKLFAKRFRISKSELEPRSAKFVDTTDDDEPKNIQPDQAEYVHTDDRGNSKKRKSLTKKPLPKTSDFMQNAPSMEPDLDEMSGINEDVTDDKENNFRPKKQIKNILEEVSDIFTMSDIDTEATKADLKKFKRAIVDSDSE